MKKPSLNMLNTMFGKTPVKHSILLTMPEDILEYILKECDFKSRLAVRSTCRNLRNFIDTTNLTFLHNKLEVKLSPGAISMTLPSQKMDGDVLNYADKPQKFYQKILGKKKTAKEEMKYFEVFAKDFELVLRHFNGKFKDFSLVFKDNTFFPQFTFFDNLVKKMLDSVEHSLTSHGPIQVTNLTVSFVDPSQLLRTLTHFTSTKKLTLKGTGMLEKYNFEGVMETEQWKKAEKIEVGGCFVLGPVENFLHLEEATWSCQYVFLKNILEIKEAFFSTPKLQYITLTLNKSHVTFDQLIRKFGPSNFIERFPNFNSEAWFFRIPGTSQVLHFDILFLQLTLPLNHKSPMQMRFIRKELEEVQGKFSVN